MDGQHNNDWVKTDFDILLGSKTWGEKKRNMLFIPEPQDVFFCFIPRNLAAKYELACSRHSDSRVRRKSKRSNADFVLPRFKTVTYGKHSLRFLGPQLWSKLSKEERNIATLATFRTMIRKKDVTSFLEGCGSECRLCLD